MQKAISAEEINYNKTINKLVQSIIKKRKNKTTKNLNKTLELKPKKYI